MLFLRKLWLTFLFQSALDVTFLMIQLLAVLPFLSFFLSGRNPTLLVRKFFAATSFFTAPCSGSPRYRSFCIVRGYSRLFSLFLAGSLIPGRTYLLFGSLWGSRLSSFMLVLLPFSVLDLFSFLSFPSWALGLVFHGLFWASSLLGLPPLSFFNFIFHGPLVLFFWAWVL